ncbi:hypothetical protein [Paracoccus litorisediminis]|uniref:Uncharacterized protein n=1 Tax=Paracoccus litorisediminis TaxID=2006130 RepID=A0A844HQJ5_9RHOB|nr:hypothetical protein [Paracoccus litorisediminis]MTH62116.1 hypothetical protein [Paracoccus litorisediminis]
MRYAICDFDGLIIGDGEFPTLDDAQASCSGFGWVHPLEPAQNVTAGAQYVVAGEVMDLPPKPAAHLIYDVSAGAWVDPRSEADWLAELAVIRAATFMTRSDFAIRCREFSLLTEAEALQVARGEVPAGIMDLIALMPPAEQFEAEIRWSAATEIYWGNELISSLAAVTGMSDWQRDLLFLIVWPVPLAAWPEGQLHP